MSERTPIGDELLNAFLDDELEAAEREHMLAAMVTDPELARRACELRLIKEQVRHAWSAVPALPHERRGATRQGWRSTAVATLAACAVALGWVGHDLSTRGHATAPPAFAYHPEHTRVVVHLSTGGAATGKAALDNSEALLRAARESGREVQVEVLANAGGLELLREDVTAHAARIAAMRAEFDNLLLVACGQGVQRLRDDAIAVHLLPGTRVATSALDEIVIRMKEGWSYLRV